MKLLGYVRVSTNAQAEEGVSLDAQRARLAAYATALGHELVDVLADAKSASSLERPGLTEVFARLDRGEADGLLIPKLDRLTRSVRDLGTLIEERFTKHVLLSIDDRIDTVTPAGKLMLNLLTSVAQWEREENSERTKRALRQVKAEGGVIGGHPPFGLRRTTERDARGRLKLEVDPHHFAILLDCLKQRREGKTLQAIARKLESAGVPKTRGNSRWSHTCVRRVLKHADHVLRFAAEQTRCSRSEVAATT